MHENKLHCFPCNASLLPFTWTSRLTFTLQILVSLFNCVPSLLLHLSKYSACTMFPIWDVRTGVAHVWTGFMDNNSVWHNWSGMQDQCWPGPTFFVISIAYTFDHWDESIYCTMNMHQCMNHCTKRQKSSIENSNLVKIVAVNSWAVYSISPTLPKCLLLWKVN